MESQRKRGNAAAHFVYGSRNTLEQRTYNTEKISAAKKQLL